ncbi:hypothetical protein KR200_001913 [Drosophila serrata]|nr:hypothetical protein KR200_001913 [Drosophila serrata]
MWLGSPVFGSFFHSPSTVGVPVPVPFPVPSPVPVPAPVAVPTPVAVPAPVAVPVSDTVTVPAAFSAHHALAYGAPPAPPAIFKYAVAYEAPQPVIKYSLGAPVTTTTTTYSGFAAPAVAHYAPQPVAHYAAAPQPVTQYAAAPSPQFLTRFTAPPTGYHFAAPPSYSKYKLHFGSPPPHVPAAVYGAPPSHHSPIAFNSQGW